jgi:glutaminyl-peptide cyclotransferase
MVSAIGGGMLAAGWWLWASPDGGPVAHYRVVASYPHDAGAFCQGLVIADGKLYESTGQLGRSTLRQVDLASGQVEKQMNLGPEYFGEGLAIWQDQLIQLTWRNGVAFVYDRANLRYVESFRFTPEGWGLTHDGTHLFLSDGTSEIRRLDPVTRRVVGTIKVRDQQGRPVARLNELEYVEGEIWANVWQTDRIVRISPDTGLVLGWIDLSGLLPGKRSASSRPDEQGVDVLNGIAYDAIHKRLFVTGKNWPRLFEIEIVQ